MRRGNNLAGTLRTIFYILVCYATNREGTTAQQDVVYVYHHIIIHRTIITKMSPVWTMSMNVAMTEIRYLIVYVVCAYVSPEDQNNAVSTCLPMNVLHDPTSIHTCSY